MHCLWADDCRRRAVYRVENLTTHVILELCKKHMRDYVDGLRHDTGTVDVLEVSRIKGGRHRRIIIRGSLPEMEVAQV
jgi:hypothetical protein